MTALLGVGADEAETLCAEGAVPTESIIVTACGRPCRPS